MPYMLIYVVIFLAKLLEVAIATVRLVLTARGNRIAASLLAAVEITIWIIVTSTVLLGLSEDPFRAVAFGLAFVLGIYFGILIEDKLALGLSQIDCIADVDEANIIVAKLRNLGYGVTTYECEGKEGKKITINLKIHRKDIPVTLQILREFEHLFVTVTDIRKLSIGNIKRRELKMND
ncbi:MAG: DUF5698 domain-containing protein [Oscillospiraceae bacterium]|jgi:uncharacterized protein YebE (UPF0316 family)|nr:DUF5698 domain-containing protein [Oscillospiraceae bacterium]